MNGTSPIFSSYSVHEPQIRDLGALLLL